MWGCAVRTRCAKCRFVLDKVAVTPGATAIIERKCHSRKCRQEPPMYFFICDQKIEVLTWERAEAMIAET